MRKKMILSYAAVLLLFCVFTFTFVLQTVYNMVRDNLVETSSQAMTRWNSELSNIMDFGRSHILNLATNEDLQRVLRIRCATPTRDNQTQFSDFSSDQSAELTELSNQFIYSNSVIMGSIPFLLEITYRTPDGSYLPIYYSSRQNQTGVERYAPDDSWIQALEGRNGQFLWDSYSDSSNEYLRLSKLIFDTQDYNHVLGTISLDLSYEHLAHSVLNQLRIESGVNAEIFNADTGTPIGYYMLNLPEEIDIRRLSQGVSQKMIHNGEQCVFARRLSSTNFYLAGVKSLADARDTYLKSGVTLMAAAGVALLFGMVLALILTRRVMKPVVELSQTMKDVKNGDLDITVATTATDEIGELYSSFNFMIQMVNNLIQENYVTRLNQKMSELNALQSQINTHFLYNTLDTINWLAKDYHAEDISRLVTNLSTLLRTSLNNGEPELTVGLELRHARSYLNIQQVRFNGLFKVEEEIDENILQDNVIKMLLQPLVENAILHSFNQPDSISQNNRLILRTKNEGDFLLLEVQNNARPDALNEVNSRLFAKRGAPSRSYGIQSIKDRLNIAYCGKAQYFYTMDADGMLTASIRIPRQYTRPDRGVKPDIKGVLV